MNAFLKMPLRIELYNIRLESKHETFLFTGFECECTDKRGKCDKFQSPAGKCEVSLWRIWGKNYYYSSVLCKVYHILFMHDYIEGIPDFR